ncbi:MAG: DUF4738 domain-containing protein [Prevotella sp.]|nr:DUF4738 domain-containing protein [Prevotella sp.]
MTQKNWLKTGLIAALLSVAVGGCKERKQTTDIITTKPKVEAPKPVQEIGDYDQDVTVDWGGSNYTVRMQRLADRSLPIVDDGLGNRYFDNQITVRVTRNDGSEFFARTFKKSDFSTYIDGSFDKNCALLGIVFDKVEDGVLRFAASVGSPDKASDEYSPLVLKISRSGSVSISKDTQFDTGNLGEFAEYDDEDGV